MRKLRNILTDLVIDSTGLKVYGERELKVQQHGYNKRRTWRKLHLAICPDSNEVLFVKLTDNKTVNHRKKLKGYHRRSLAETGMYRFKTLFGSSLKSRTFQGQQSEAYVKSKALNVMTNLGMPQSERIAF